MNRRGFLGALAAAPFAALAAPAVAKPVFATGGYIKPQYGVVGEMAGESILPFSDFSWSGNPARVMQSIFNDAYGATHESDRRFDEMAAYCDEVVEVADL